MRHTSGADVLLFTEHTAAEITGTAYAVKLKSFAF